MISDELQELNHVVLGSYLYQRTVWYLLEGRFSCSMTFSTAYELFSSSVHAFFRGAMSELAPSSNVTSTTDLPSLATLISQLWNTVFGTFFWLVLAYAGSELMTWQDHVRWGRSATYTLKAMQSALNAISTRSLNESVVSRCEAWLEPDMSVIFHLLKSLLFLGISVRLFLNRDALWLRCSVYRVSRKKNSKCVALLHLFLEVSLGYFSRQ